MIGARIVSNLVVSKHDEKKSGNRLLVVYPSVPVPPQHPKRPAASGCRSGQRGGFFLEAAGNPRGISGRYPPSWLRRLPGAATTNRTMSPTPAAAPSASGDDEFTEVVVVRHGETSWNASRIVQVGRPLPILSRPSTGLVTGNFSILQVLIAFVYACFDLPNISSIKGHSKVSIFNYLIAQCLFCHIYVHLPRKWRPFCPGENNISSIHIYIHDDQWMIQ
jgi:hypothetical protein